MQLWSASLGVVMPHVAGCTIPLAEQAMKRAASVFFARTRSWVEQVAVSTVDNKIYTLALPSGCNMVRIEDMVLNGREQQKDDIAAVTATLGRLEFGSPAQREISLMVSLAPSSSDSAGIPDELYASYGQVIEHGALAELMAMPEQEFSSATHSAYHQEIFERAIAAHAVDAWRGRIGYTKPQPVAWC